MRDITRVNLKKRRNIVHVLERDPYFLEYAKLNLVHEIFEVKTFKYFLIRTLRLLFFTTSEYSLKCNRVSPKSSFIPYVACQYMYRYGGIYMAVICI